MPVKMGGSQKVIDGQKICLTCKKWLELECFSKADSSSGRSARCNKCLYRAQQNRASTDSQFSKKLKEKQSRAHKKYKYGLTQQDYQNFINEQNSSCAICFKVLDSTSIELTPHIDHCHETNIIRGVLCGHCNRGLGHFFDHPNILANAIKYLRKFENDLTN